MSDGDDVTDDENDLISDISDQESLSDDGDLSDDDDDFYDAQEFINEDANNGDDLLYPAAPLTVMESVLSILSLYLRDNLTIVALTHILQLISLHCPKPNNSLTSWYKINKFISTPKNQLKCHYYCPDCHQILDEKNAKHPLCSKSNDGHYFIEGCIESQISALFKRKGFKDKLLHKFSRTRKNSGNFEDIYDGNIYEELNGEGGILSYRYNISMTWYTDGVPIFKSFKFCI